MKVVRIKLRQNAASYAREETSDNKMTYPLPHFSTIIGAIHNACGYTEYKPMDISVQGRFRSMQREVYANHTLLNSTNDDRSIYGITILTLLAVGTLKLQLQGKNRKIALGKVSQYRYQMKKNLNYIESQRI